MRGTGWALGEGLQGLVLVLVLVQLAVLLVLVLVLGGHGM
jgi:hypothetical protein